MVLLLPISRFLHGGREYAVGGTPGVLHLFGKARAESLAERLHGGHHRLEARERVDRDGDHRHHLSPLLLAWTSAISRGVTVTPSSAARVAHRAKTTSGGGVPRS